MTAVERLAKTALEADITIAVAESLTSGLVASKIGAGSDASRWFRGAITAYQTSVKESLLGLRPGVDPCSGECASTLAAGALSMFDADVAVSTTGIGGPDPQDGHDPGTVYLGWATATKRGNRLLNLSGSPEEIIDQTAMHAVGLLIEIIQRHAHG